MRTIAIIGGKLQGTEAAYLARKAGMKSLLIDKNPKAPASGICDEMGVFDVLKKEKELIDFLKKADLILPALENDAVHTALLEIAKEHKMKLAFDSSAYAVSSSKIRSDRLMRENNIPAPEYFPGGGGPYIMKPSGESGSAGVMRAETKEAVRAFLSKTDAPEEWVVQEFLEGPSYSIEVIGIPGAYRTYEITQIHMDEVYDCNMVSAPCALSAQMCGGFSDMAVKLAELVHLSGIMDVEVIEHNGVLKALEIDARFPSQTPIAVYHSTGVNLLLELTNAVLDEGWTEKSIQAREDPAKSNEQKKLTAVEHYLVDSSGVHFKGEHMMGEGGALLHKENFFGADEAITDYREGCESWRAMMINAGQTERELSDKRSEMLRSLTALHPGQKEK